MKQKMLLKYAYAYDVTKSFQSNRTSDILVLKIILVLVFIQFGLIISVSVLVSVLK